MESTISRKLIKITPAEKRAHYEALGCYASKPGVEYIARADRRQVFGSGRNDRGPSAPTVVESLRLALEGGVVARALKIDRCFRDAQGGLSTWAGNMSILRFTTSEAREMIALA